ncbi:left-right determination factor 2-like [Carassius carassius]|uniref:left-right determination factor 2-like n=1 Tax=Carassius carassius TaxID=217509 RepID=UPI0028695B63|nr:left-right determination factor 2-like [Carassius carassius]
MALLIQLFICATVISFNEGFDHEDMKQAMLQKLGLTDLPRIQKRDLENLVIPAHIKNKYLSMLKLHHKRRRRSLPSLAGILRGIHGNADIRGEIKYSDTTRQRLVFDMESRLQENTEVTMAELKLFQTAAQNPSKPERRHHRPINNARVSIYWVEVLANGSNRTSLIDSRLVPIHESGWRSFDVTQAIHYWSKAQKKAPLHLEVWTEGERPGSYAAEMAKRVHFATQDPKENTLEKDVGAPELVFYTLNLDEYGSQGNCNSSPNSSKCCREEHFINFRELTWTQYWIIEPAGYQAFRCAGGCKQPKHSYYGYGQRTCAVMESAPLPMMYLVKKGDYTEIEVAEFPNMIVEKCGCSMDKISPV